MPVFWLPTGTPFFPNPELANSDGILAVGGDLSPERLLLAYRAGIFPWFNPGDQILWWSPDPRFVLFPKKLKVSKSMRPYFNQKKFTVTYDQHFEEVMRQCQAPREGQPFGTWITEEMIRAYVKLYEKGYCHSVEVWQDSEMVGGLYGLSLGKVYFGESMFSNLPNASKFGFISLVKKLQSLGFWLIDCQQETKHLESLGAEAIPRKDFLGILKKNETEETFRGDWQKLFNIPP
ncbi:MAG: leucyl/phenylalanyl-tRNA--protein transferase [Lewinellaceae bacterium]|nr:leucyl/phenylalanyl-tRNA--protein transferase [Saprospiraceae bacterium]MCB9337616.1 leucyl/phenylalanyl-tRNA--protein transferase [Lewinellaceae bacterium]